MSYVYRQVPVNEYQKAQQIRWTFEGAAKAQKSATRYVFSLGFLWILWFVVPEVNGPFKLGDFPEIEINAHSILIVMMTIVLTHALDQYIAALVASRSAGTELGLKFVPGAGVAAFEKVDVPTMNGTFGAGRAAFVRDMDTVINVSRKIVFTVLLCAAWLWLWNKVWSFRTTVSVLPFVADVAIRLLGIIIYIGAGMRILQLIAVVMPNRAKEESQDSMT